MFCSFAGFYLIFFSQFILLPKTKYHFWKAMNVVLFSLKVTKVICPVRIWSYFSKFIKQPPAFDSYSVQQTHFSFETYTQTHKLQFSDHLCSFMFLHKPALCAQMKNHLELHQRVFCQSSTDPSPRQKHPHGVCRTNDVPTFFIFVLPVKLNYER